MDDIFYVSVMIIRIDIAGMPKSEKRVNENISAEFVRQSCTHRLFHD
jgi:hypothetical protein